MNIFRKIDGTISKKRVLLALFLLFPVLQIIQNARQTAADAEAVEAGWTSANEQEMAALVGCKDKACYDKYGADIERKNAAYDREQEKLKAAEEAKLAAEQEAKAEAAEKLGASTAPSRGQVASTANETGDPYFDMELPGYKERFCRAWAKANVACLSGSNYRSCVIARMSMEFKTSSPNFGAEGVYICNEDGSRKY